MYEVDGFGDVWLRPTYRRRCLAVWLATKHTAVTKEKRERIRNAMMPGRPWYVELLECMKLKDDRVRDRTVFLLRQDAYALIEGLRLFMDEELERSRRRDEWSSSRDLKLWDAACVVACELEMTLIKSRPSNRRGS